MAAIKTTRPGWVQSAIQIAGQGDERRIGTTAKRNAIKRCESFSDALCPVLSRRMTSWPSFWSRSTLPCSTEMFSRPHRSTSSSSLVLMTSGLKPRKSAPKRACKAVRNSDVSSAPSGTVSAANLDVSGAGSGMLQRSRRRVACSVSINAPAIRESGSATGRRRPAW